LNLTAAAMVFASPSILKAPCQDQGREHNGTAAPAPPAASDFFSIWKTIAPLSIPIADGPSTRERTAKASDGLAAVATPAGKDVVLAQDDDQTTDLTTHAPGDLAQTPYEKVKGTFLSHCLLGFVSSVGCSLCRP